MVLDGNTTKIETFALKAEKHLLENAEDPILQMKKNETAVVRGAGRVLDIEYWS